METRLVIIILLVHLIVIYYFVVGRHWLKCRLAGVAVSQADILFMRFRGVPAALLTDELVRAHKAGVPLTRMQLEMVYLSGGDIRNVVSGLIYAKRAESGLTYKDALELYLNNVDIATRLKET